MITNILTKMDKQDICIKIINTLVTDYTANLMCSWHELNTLGHPGGGSGPRLGSEREPTPWCSLSQGSALLNRLLKCGCHELTHSLCVSVSLVLTDLGFVIFLPFSSLAGLGFILRHNGKNEISKTFAGQENHFLPSSISASKILFGGSFSELILPLCAIWSTVVF